MPSNLSSLDGSSEALHLTEKMVKFVVVSSNGSTSGCIVEMPRFQSTWEGGQWTRLKAALPLLFFNFDDLHSPHLLATGEESLDRNTPRVSIRGRWYLRKKNYSAFWLPGQRGSHFPPVTADPC